MVEKIVFSVPGAGGKPIAVPTAAGMPSGPDNLNIAVQWGLSVVFAGAAIVALFFIIWGGNFLDNFSGGKRKNPGSKK